MDSSRVMMADVNIPKVAFDEWSVSDYDYKTRMVEMPCTVGYINVKDVLYAIEGASKDSVRFDLSALLETKKVKDSVTVRKPEKCPKCGRLTVDNKLPPEKRGKDGNSYKCSCGWRGKVRQRSKTVKRMIASLIGEKSGLTVSVGKERYELALLSASDYEEPPKDINLLRFDAKIIMNLAPLISNLKKMSKKFDNVKFIADKDKFAIRGNGDEVRSAEVVYERGSDDVIELSVHGGVQKAVYSIDNLLCVLPRLGDLVELKYSTNMPLKTNIKTANYVDVNFYLAPCIIAE